MNAISSGGEMPVSQGGGTRRQYQRLNVHQRLKLNQLSDATPRLYPQGKDTDD